MSTKVRDFVIDPAPLTLEPADILAWTHQALHNLAFQLNNGVPRLRFVDQNTPLEKPRDGDVVFADGTNWNPGSGKGFYGFYNGTYHFLG